MIFDFDGTIADSAELYVNILNSVSDKLRLPKLDINELRQLTRMPLTERCKKLGIPLYRLTFLNRKMHKEIKNYVHEIEWVEGIEDQLIKLKNKGFKLVIISSNSTENIKAFLKKSEFEIFDIIYTSSRVFSKHKVINKLIKRLKIDKEEAIYIGDEYRDIMACKKAGIKIISVAWGFDSKELLMEGHPDYIANTPEELTNIICRISGIN